MIFFLEIKNRILLICSGVLIVLTQMYLYKNTMLFVLIKPNISQKVNFYFICTNITEGFFSYWYIILIFCIHFFLVFLILHMFLFFLPGLYHFEKTFLFIFGLLYLSFCLFFIYIFNNMILPFSWSFFNRIILESFYKTEAHITKTKYLSLFFEIKIMEYLNFYYALYSISTIITHILFILSIKLHIILKNSSLKIISKYRSKTYFLFFVFSTVLTPPDIMSQLTVALILIIFLELIVFLIILYHQF